MYFRYDFVIIFIKTIVLLHIISNIRPPGGVLIKFCIEACLCGKICWYLNTKIVGSIPGGDYTSAP